jgi:A/G-specific adenine glycosylase
VVGLCRVGLEGGWERIPAPRVRAVTPQRELSLLVLISAGQVLLEERPPEGIWGGLLSLPEHPPSDAGTLARVLEQDLGIGPVKIEALPVIRHAFTHFRLVAQPWLVRVESAAFMAGERPSDASIAAGRLRWVPLDRVEDAALPQPIKRLLLSIG